MIRRFILALLALLLAGCFPAAVPTQKRPSCSWSTATPSNADALCHDVFQTLKTVVNAEQTGDRTDINRLVPTKRVAVKIIRYGDSLRAQGVSGLHVVPSFTMEMVRPGYVGAGFYILGQTSKGRVNAPQTIELRLRGNQALIVNDQPGQEW